MEKHGGPDGPGPTPRGGAVDRLFRYGAAAVAFGVLGLIVVFAIVLAQASWPTTSYGGPNILLGCLWNPNTNVYGGCTFIVGTLVTAAIALLLAVPLSLGIAIFLVEQAPRWVRGPLGALVELLAAIPSVVYGLWGLLVLAPFMKTNVEPWLHALTHGTGPFSAGPTGSDLLTAGVILAVMVVPTIASISREALLAVPRDQREGALSLGATRWETTRVTVLSYARVGIVGAIILGLGRAVGETMAVTMTVGNSYSFPTSLLSSGQTIASLIATEFPNADHALEKSALIEMALVLIALTLIINIGARLLIRRLVRKEGTESGAPSLWPKRQPRLRHRREEMERRFKGVRTESPREVPPLDERRGSGPGSPVVRTTPRWSHARDARRRYWGMGMGVMTFLCVAIALVPLAAILFEAVAQGARVLSPSFLASSEPGPCNPQVNGGPCPIGGIWPGIEGTLVLMGLSGLIAVPVGILTGIYVAELSHRKGSRMVSFFADVMTGVPSIVVGVFVFAVLVLLSQAGWLSTEYILSSLGMTIALAIIMIPIVARTTEDALRAVPENIREAALALGIPQYRATLRIVLSAARGGVITGALLATMRAGGETAPLLIAGFPNRFGFLGLNQGADTLPVLIYNWGRSGIPNWVADAWGVALVLVFMMLAISLSARLLLQRQFQNASE